MTARCQYLVSLLRCAVLACLFGGLAVPAVAAEVELTFFGWSDQHVQTSGDASHLVPAIDCMNQLPGKAYPPRIGGTVARPAFVFGCGDITEWPTHAAKTAYEKLILKRLKFPAYDIAGNHDEGGKSPSETIKKWITARHGGLSYTFDSSGVRIVALFSKFDDNLDNPAQPLTREALDFLRNELRREPKESPQVVAMHHCFDSLTNRDELIDAFGKSNVILVLGGHYHQSKVDRYRGVNFVQLPSPAKNGPGQVMVFRITGDRLVAIPWSYRDNAWADRPGLTLDTAIRGPGAPARQQ
jgi:3',5'-cyclic AMP phosphodiesterase CpdA